MSRPSVRSGVADTFHAPRERIVEFSDRATQLGGLIGLRVIDTPDGPRLRVDVYRTDPGVEVCVEVGRAVWAGGQAVTPEAVTAAERGTRTVR